jgi:Ni,Fe-hydrogenase III component G
MNDPQPYLQTAAELLAPWQESARAPEAGRLDVIIQRKHLLAAVQALVQARWGYLSAITGLDRPGSSAPADEEKQWNHTVQPEEAAAAAKPPGALEVLYHFCKGAAVLTLRVSVPYAQPEVASICPLIPAATLYERELIEMFGVVVTGTPNTDRLLLPDDWPAEVYPLRKAFHGFTEGLPEEEAKTP